MLLAGSGHAPVVRPEDEAELAANEAVFRDANERIRQADEAFSPPLERVPFLCECDDVNCREPIPMTTEDYEDVRREPTLFAILPGHSSQGDVVSEKPGYLVVRKTEEAAEVARALDPRKGVT